MHYSRDNIARIAFGELTPIELQKSVVAIEGFSRLFGKPWIDDYFAWDKHKLAFQDPSFDQAFVEEHFRVGSMPVLDLVSYWDDWCLLKNQVGAGKILKRWRKAVAAQGVISEIFVAALLCRAGMEVELEPAIPSRRVCDCRFRYSQDAPWVYVEVSMRGESSKPAVVVRSEDIRARAAKAAAHVIPGLLGTVAVLREPTPQDVEAILSWLGSIHTPGEHRLDDLAVFFTGMPGENPPGNMEKVFKLIKGVVPFKTHVELKGALGQACLHIPDRMHCKIVKDEGSQLPNDASGVVVIDATRMEDFNSLPKLAEEVFQIPDSAKISCLVFFRTMWTSSGRRTESRCCINPRAAHPIREREAAILRGTFSD